jgi:predicted nucleic acid-binding protein
LLNQAGGSGNLVTDAQLAAFALEYRGTVHTADTDFQRFTGVKWFNPITGLKG